MDHPFLPVLPMPPVPALLGPLQAVLEPLPNLAQFVFAPPPIAPLLVLPLQLVFASLLQVSPSDFLLPLFRLVSASLLQVSALLPLLPPLQLVFAPPPPVSPLDVLLPPFRFVSASPLLVSAFLPLLEPFHRLFSSFQDGGVSLGTCDRTPHLIWSTDRVYESKREGFCLATVWMSNHNPLEWFQCLLVYCSAYFQPLIRITRMHFSECSYQTWHTSRL